MVILLLFEVCGVIGFVVDVVVAAASAAAAVAVQLLPAARAVQLSDKGQVTVTMMITMTMMTAIFRVGFLLFLFSIRLHRAC